MGNLLQQCQGGNNTLLELDRPEAVYLPNDIVTGTVLYRTKNDASISLTGAVYFKKRKKSGIKPYRITFFSTEFDLNIHSKHKQNFELRLDELLPPSFHDLNTCPNITYSVNLISKRKLLTSIPIHVCPRVQIDRPLLLTPLFFGPVENHISGIKLEVKLKRSIFTFDDIIEMFYELQNPNQEFIPKMEISLGIYYSIESDIFQNDVSNGIESCFNGESNNKLIRNKALIKVPKNNLFPPTFKFQYGGKADQSSFTLTIEYKIQFKVYLGTTEDLWQIDIPIIVCNDTIE